jgi:hypothetical protein
LVSALAFSAALLPALLSTSRAEAANTFDGTQNVEVYQGLVLSSARILALSGAYVGIAEGQDGQSFNVAALAQRDRQTNEAWGYDLTLSLNLSSLAPSLLPAKQDDAGGNIGDHPTQHALTEVGIMFQAGRFGVGFLFRRFNFSTKTLQGDTIGATSNDLSLGVAYGFLHESLLVGAEVVLGGATIDGPNNSTGAGIDFSTPKVRLGTLFRPRDLNFRLGLQVEPGVVAHRSAAYGLPLSDGLLTPAGVSLPWVVRAGGSVWIGPNASFYNAPSPQARSEEVLEAHLNNAPEPTYREPSSTGWQPLMLTVEADLVGTSPDAISLTDFVQQQSGQPARLVGTGVTVSPHAGAEWEAVPRWIRIRGGSYYEPSRYGGTGRIHGTFGGDIRLPLYVIDLRLSAAADFASNYQDVAFSLGTWHDVGPQGTIGVHK